MVINYFLPGIIALGLITSYQDMKYGKIKNKWIILGIFYAVVVNIILYIQAYQDPNIGINMHYTIELFTNFIFAVLAGYLLYHFKVWTAGDGKLFITFAALIPFTIYKVGYEEWIPSIILLVNIFIPAFLLMILAIILRAKEGNIGAELKSSLKRFMKPRVILTQIISIFAIFWLAELLLSVMGLDNNFLLAIILTIGAMFYLQSRLGNRTLTVMIIIAAARLVFDSSVFSASALITFFLIVLLWMFVITVLGGSLSSIGRVIFRKRIDVSQLKPGMFLGEVILQADKSIKERLKKLKEIETVQLDDSYYLKGPATSLDQNKSMIELGEGITQSDINKIKATGFRKIYITQTIPFAPLIFLGVILTLLAKGNILIVIKNLIL